MSRPKNYFLLATNAAATTFAKNAREPANQRSDVFGNDLRSLKAKNKMTLSRALSIATILVMAVQTQPAWAEGRLPQNGSYEITARLELPHLERWAVDKKAIICLPGLPSVGGLPIPIISANNPFAKCSTANVTTETPKLEYDIVCPERGSARGHAIYIISVNGFSGRVAMVLGAKNMTMTEVQQARRIGGCSPGAPGTNLPMTQ